MAMLKFIKHERLLLQRHPELNEKWVQDRIAEDPSILGLGDVVLKDKERIQPRAGRLDLLLQDPDTLRRYEVEIQLGKTDEAHIIRTIEYWDIERKRYPQYDHCAVIVAEEMTARFLNVISLFNGTIPLIAIQLNALRISDGVSLVFTTVMDELSRGMVDDDEEVQAVTDRAFWEEQGSRDTVGMADELLTMIHGFDPEVQFKYNKFYIGLAKNGQPNNFAQFRAKKSNLRLELRLKETPETTKELEESGLDLMDYDKRWGRYRIRLDGPALKSHRDLLTRLMKQASDDSE
jgi:hypothetical protein